MFTIKFVAFRTSSTGEDFPSVVYFKFKLFTFAETQTETVELKNSAEKIKPATQYYLGLPQI
jgi:hypothetical protein